MLNRGSWAGLGVIVAAACAGGPNAAGDETVTFSADRVDSTEVGVREPPWPYVTATLPPLDIRRIVPLTPDSSEALFRTDVAVTLEEGVTDAEIVAFLRRFDAWVTAVAGAARTSEFFLRIPDPGSEVEALYAVVDRMQQEPMVRRARTLLASPPRLSSTAVAFARDRWSLRIPPL